MAKEQTNDGKRFDPMSAWREMRDTYLDNWAKVMVEAVNTDAYAQATGTLLDNYLTASAPFREALEKVMLSTLAQLSLPSRADFVSIAERITNLEMRLDDMDAKLDRIERWAAQSAAAKAAPRGKQGGQKR
jgi:polyhydroxyalkanoic acid synthase PhaR subunit